MIEFQSETRRVRTSEANPVGGRPDKPQPGRGEVLIRVHAAGVNPADFLAEDGEKSCVVKTKYPHGRGLCVSGIVVAKGANVATHDLGSAVFGHVPKVGLDTCAEFVPVPASHVREMPANTGFREAAGLPLVGSVVIQAFDRAGLRAGDHVLIHEGGGAVGSFAIQYAKFLGATVFTTTSTENADWVRGLGADSVLDYQLVDYRDIVHDLDIVLDTLGGDATFSAFDVIRTGGTVISLFGPVDDKAARRLGLNPLVRQVLWFKARELRRKAREKNARYRFIPMMPETRHLATLRDLVETGRLRPVVDATGFVSSSATDALAYQEKGRAKGTIVVDFAG
ncbi:NADP-dependent oxidoreductase [Roseibium sp.]|uniref:NADP-dependent oxidoreductase n=1 Tax=Roseibium sp. TaxID=1936156 RepID=UPI003BAA95B0